MEKKQVLVAAVSQREVFSYLMVQCFEDGSPYCSEKSLISKDS